MNAAWLLLALVALAHPLDQAPKKEAQKGQATASPDELMKQAETKQSAGDVDGAIELLRRAASAATTGEASLRLGRALEAKLDLDGALDAYAAAAPTLNGAGKGEALGRLSVIQSIRAKAEAPTSADAAATADPAGPWPQIALAHARARAGRVDDAVTAAEKAVAAGGGAPALAARGAALETKGDLAGAEKAYREAMEKDLVTAPIGLARVLRRTERAAEAEPLLAKVIAAAPGAVEAYKESARAKIALGRPDDALGDASTAAALAEGDADAKKLVGEVAVARALSSVSKGQVDAAIRDLTQLRDQSPQDANVHLALGKALVAKRQGDAALAELQKAVELDPGSAEAQYQLGYATHRLKQNPTGAVGPLEKAVSAEPANPTYRSALGAALSEAKQYDRAIAELGKVTQSPAGAKAEPWILLGASQLGAQKYKDALATLEKASSLAGENAQIEAYLAWSYFGLKDAASFKTHGAKARALGHNEPTLLQYLARIEKGEAIK